MIDASSRAGAAPRRRTTEAGPAPAPPSSARWTALVGAVALLLGCLAVASCGGGDAAARETAQGSAAGAATAPPLVELPPFQERPADGGARVAERGDGRGPAAGATAPGGDGDAPRFAAPRFAGPRFAGPAPQGDDEPGAGGGLGGDLDGDLDGDALAREVAGAVQLALRRATRSRAGDYDASETTVAVSLVDLRTGERLVDRLGGARLRPASNMKIITAAAALLALGPDAAFETPFHAMGPIEGGALRGDLVAEAGGDPLHVREGDGSLDRWLDPLAASLRDAGVARIDGALVLDEGSFADPGPGPEWPGATQLWRDYCALSGGFSANGGNFRATVRPGRVGGSASVVLRPRDHGLEERVGVRTGKANDLRIGATETTVTVRGTVPATPSVRVEEFRHPDPVELFGHAVVEGLRRRGIAVAGGFRRERGAGPEPIDASSRGPAPLHVMRSPLTSVLEAVLLDSNNPVADQVFLTMGARLAGAGTRAGGAEAVTRALADAGVDVDDLVQVGGSGLSKANRATARTLVDALSAIASTADLTPAGHEARAIFLASLPKAAISGSLAGRMGGTAADGRVWAKTGWVAGASGLSGYVCDRDGEPALAFSILVEYPRVGGLNNAAWKPMQDEMCVAFTEALDAAEPRR